MVGPRVWVVAGTDVVCVVVVVVLFLLLCFSCCRCCLRFQSVVGVHPKDASGLP